jgi:hypothetical protein
MLVTQRMLVSSLNACSPHSTHQKIESHELSNCGLIGTTKIAFLEAQHSVSYASERVKRGLEKASRYPLAFFEAKSILHLDT